jgi:hypothetical protein
MEDNGQGVATTTETTATVDYEAEYKKMVAERDGYKAEAEKQKKLKDQYATENAEYKKKSVENMSAEEKRQKEYDELVEREKNLLEKVVRMETEKELLANGFTTEETDKLIKGGCPMALAKTIAEIYNTRKTEFEKTLKAQLLKETTQSSPMGKGTVGGDQKTSYQAYMEAKNQEANEVKL